MKNTIKILAVSTIIFFTSCSKDDSPVNNHDPKLAKEKEAKLIKQLDDNGKLLAYYPFNNSANDESSNSNNGELNNVVIASDRFGNEKSAYEFKTSSRSYISIPSFGQVSSFTITAWIKLRGGSQTAYEYHQAIVGKSTSSRREYLLRKNSADYGNTLFSNFDTPSNNITGQFGALSKDTWMHVALTYRDGTVALYHNGSKSSDKRVTPIQWLGGNVTIGAIKGAEFFNGVIDDVIFVNRVLTTEEIKVLANNK